MAATAVAVGGALLLACAGPSSNRAGASAPSDRETLYLRKGDRLYLHLPSQSQAAAQALERYGWSGERWAYLLQYEIQRGLAERGIHVVPDSSLAESSLGFRLDSVAFAPAGGAGVCVLSTRRGERAQTVQFTRATAMATEEAVPGAVKSAAEAVVAAATRGPREKVRKREMPVPQMWIIF